MACDLAIATWGRTAPEISKKISQQEQGKGLDEENGGDKGNSCTL
jgi:hypothetical protein